MKTLILDSACSKKIFREYLPFMGVKTLIWNILFLRFIDLKLHKQMNKFGVFKTTLQLSLRRRLKFKWEQFKTYEFDTHYLQISFFFNNKHVYLFLFLNGLSSSNQPIMYPLLGHRLSLYERQWAAFHHIDPVPVGKCHMSTNSWELSALHVLTLWYEPTCQRVNPFSRLFFFTVLRAMVMKLHYTKYWVGWVQTKLGQLTL